MGYSREAPGGSRHEGEYHGRNSGGDLTIVGPIVLLLVFIWVVMRSRGRAGEASNEVTEHATEANYEAEDRARDEGRKATSERPRFPSRRGLVRRARLGAAPPPARDARPAATADTPCWSPPPGAGKTLAGFLPTICDLAENPAEGLHTLYVSPLKALAVDVQRNLLGPIEEMGLPIRVETRSGDTPSDRKARQRVRPPHILLTTPELLSLLLSYPDSAPLFDGLKTVVVDEIHAFAARNAAICSACRWPACRPSRPAFAASACPRRSAIPTLTAAGSRPTPTSTRSAWSRAIPAPIPTCRS